MAVKRRKFSRDFKLQVVREVEAGKAQAQIAREHEISQNLISRWCRQHRRYKERAFSGNGRAHTDEARIANLERMVGRLTMENDLLKSLTEARGRNVIKEHDWNSRMTQLITQVASETPSGARAIRGLSAAVGISPATYYRQRQAAVPTAANGSEPEVRQAIQQIALEMPSYGHRPMTAELQRRGLSAGRERVLRYMREDNLLCRRRRAFVSTTDSKHVLKVFPNLARELLVTGSDQLWVADITYIRLPREFVYLAVVLDAFSRRVIGWALERHMMTELALSALQMALNTRQPQPGLMHHSDQGKQYASADYVSLLVKHQIRISMSRTANPYDNAKAERFMRTVKYEEVYLADYQTLTEARASINHFIEEVYNRKRLHSALGYRPPVEFEQLCSQPLLA